jgi:hypothetical protein
VAQLYPRALCSILVTFYDSQGYGGLIVTRLYPGHVGLILARLHTGGGGTETDQSQSHITTDNQSASPSWCEAPIWDPWPMFISPWDFILDSYCLLFYSALSHERTGL